MKRLLRPLLWIGAAGAAGAAAAAGFVYSGIYDISAVKQHTKPVYLLIETAMRRSVMRRANDEVMPPLAPGAAARGLRLFHDHCVQCHGGPGVAPEPFALSMTPVPANLVATARKWTVPEIHWVVRNGVKMTGMPAWAYRMSAQQMWEVAAFVGVLPTLSPRRYQERERAAAGQAPATPVGQQTADEGVPLGPPDVERGRMALTQYACMACHAIPGVTASNRQVGPPLAGIARRKFLAGMLPNTPENLVRWIRFPQQVDALSAMPDLRVTEGDAQDMAAYLQTLDETR